MNKFQIPTKLKNNKWLNNKPNFNYKVLNIGHRGAKSLALENTLESIEKALQNKADAIEIDLRKTKDNKIVAIHDDNVKRITKETKGFIKDLTLEELNKIKLKNNKPIASFEEILNLVRNKAELLIDLKEPKALPYVLKTLKRKNLNSAYLYSDNPKTLIQSKQISPEIRRGGIFYALSNGRSNFEAMLRSIPTFVNFIRLYEKMDLSFISSSQFTLNHSLIDYFHSKKLKVFVWGGIKTEEKMFSLMLENIDGIITDRPDLLNDLKEKIKNNIR